MNLLGVLTLVGVFVVVLLAAMAISFFRIGRSSRRRAATWGRVARHLGLTWEGSTISGRLEGARVRLRREWVRMGSARGQTTIVSGDVVPASDMGLSVCRRRPFQRQASQLVGMSEIEVGDPEFEREHSIAADEPERVRVVLDREMRQVLQEAARTSPHFSVDDSGISIVFGPGEENERSLESSLRTAGRVARLMTERRERIPVAAPLRQHRQAWTAYAAAMGMECMDCPLYIRGRMECATISARAVRLASLRYRLEVLVRFDTPLGLGLSATPSSSTDAARSQACGQDEKLGDPVFDDAFTTRISRPEVLSSILDAETRQRLLEVQGLVDSVQLDDDGVTVRAAQIDPEPTAVPRLVALVRSLAGGIARNAAAVGSKISGPYR